jgi:hypothetical protein
MFYFPTPANAIAPPLMPAPAIAPPPPIDEEEEDELDMTADPS